MNKYLIIGALILGVVGGWFLCQFCLLRTNTINFYALPLIGSKPLTVYFSISEPSDWPKIGTSDRSNKHQTKLYYGDGDSDFVIPGNCHACGGKHIYELTGVYTAKLTKYNNYPDGPEELVGTIKIAVE